MFSITTLSQISAYQTLISAVISAFIVIVGLFIKEYFERNRSRKNYIRDVGYATHERLRDNLRGFLRSDSYVFLLIPNKVSAADEARLNMSYKNFEAGSRGGGVFSDFSEVTLYQQQFEYFEKTLLPDILKVSKLSVPRVQKVASQIEDLYDETKAEESTLSDLWQDELTWARDGDMGPVITEKERSYIQFIREAHKKIFWVEAQKLLLKLEKEVERVVKLQL
jgi:hypothetical protein